VLKDDEGDLPLQPALPLHLAVSLATKPGLSEDHKNWKSVLRGPTGEEVAFETMIDLARWAAARALS
jgi:hypothetical protein